MRTTSNKGMKYASTEQAKKYSYSIDDFTVEIEVLEKLTQTLIVKLTWRQIDNRSPKVKYENIGDISNYLYKPIKTFIKERVNASKVFCDQICITDFPEVIQHKRGGLMEVELYLSTEKFFEFSHTKRNSIKEVIEAELIVCDLMIYLKNLLQNI